MRIKRTLIAAVFLLALILPLALVVQSSGLQPGSYDPASAYDPASNRFLLVFTDVDYYGIPGIYGLLVGPDASPIGSPTRISHEDAYIDGQGNPSVAYSTNDNVFLVSWHDLREGSSDIYASVVTIDEDTSNSIVPHDDFAVYAGFSESINPRVGYSAGAGNFLIAWQEATLSKGYDIYARALFYEDMHMSEALPVYTAKGEQGEISIAASHDGGAYFLAFQDDSAGLEHPTISGQIIDAYSLTPLIPIALGLDVSGAVQGGYAPSVSSGSAEDTEFIIAWSGPEGQIRARYMNDSDNSIYPFDTVFEPDGRQQGPATKVLASYDESTDRAVLVWQELKEHGLHDIYYMFLNGHEAEVYHIDTVAAEQDMDELGIAISYNSKMPSFLVAYEYTNNTDTFNVLLSTLSDPDYPAIKVNDPVWPFEDLALSYPAVAYDTAVSHTLNVYNDSPYAWLNISNISASGPFYVTGGNCTLGPIVPEGAPCAVTVEFSPQAGGPATGSLSITSDDPNEPELTLHLSGMGLAPRIRVTDTLMPEGDLLLDFGSIKVGQSETATVTINNKGNHTLYLGSLMLMAEGFEITRDDCSMQALMPNSFCTFDVLASPTEEGLHSGILWLHSDDPLKPALALELTAVGRRAKLSIDSDALHFGYGLLGQTTLKKFRIDNTGGAALSIDSVSVSGESFSIDDNSCGGRDIAPSESCTLTLGFTPSGLFGYAGQLIISSEGTEHTVRLTGNGAVPIAAITRSVNFGDITLGGSSIKSIRVTNIGQVALSTWIEDIEGHGFAIARDECGGAALAYAASCDIYIEMSPDETGLYMGAIVMGTSDPDERLVIVSLTGMATPDRGQVLDQYFYGYEN